MEATTSNIREGEVVVPCTDLDAALALLRSLGFLLESISPADDPAVAVTAGHGVRLRLERGVPAPAPIVRLACREPAAVAGGAREVVLPGGARIEIVHEEIGFTLPPLVPSYTVTRA